MRKEFLLFLSLSLFLNYCNAQKVLPIDLKRRVYNEIPLNIKLNSELGDKLITTGVEEYQDGLKIIECPQFKISIPNRFGNEEYPNIKGKVLPLSGICDNWFLYYNPNEKLDNPYIEINFGVAVDKNNNVITPFIKVVGERLGTKIIEGFKTGPDTFVNNNCSNCFKQEFIYNGKVGTNLKFVYREYINDMVRPAFNQDLQYDLNESNLVGFKGLRLEIINATNTNIEYKILSSFNKMK